MKTRPFLMFLFFLVSISAFSQGHNRIEEECFFWWEKVGNGIEDINQFIPGLCKKETLLENERWLKEEREREKHFFFDFCWSIPMGLFNSDSCPQVLDTKKIPKSILGKVITRKEPLYNSFAKQHHKKMSSELASSIGKRPFFCLTPHTPYGYLEFLQIALLIQLIANKDLRFEVEAREMFRFLEPHNPAKFSYFALIDDGLIKTYLRMYLSLFKPSSR